MEYKIGITSYDEWHELWETHIALDMELEYSVWGKTEQESKEKAFQFMELLNFKASLFAKVSA